MYRFITQLWLCAVVTAQQLSNPIVSVANYTGIQSAVGSAVDRTDNSIYLWSQQTATTVSLTKISSSNTSALWQSSFGNQTYASQGLSSNQPQIDPSTSDVFVSGWTSGNFHDQASVPSSSWTVRNSTADVTWHWILWVQELGLFVAIARSNSALAISSNGINWTAVTAPVANDWTNICWSPDLKLLVAVAQNGDGKRIMLSRDAINWEAITALTLSNWHMVVWSPKLRLFVVSSYNPISDQIASSPDGRTWTIASTSANGWECVVWSPELEIFVAAARTGSNEIMTSTNGLNWTVQVTSFSGIEFRSIVWSPQHRLFVAGGHTGIVITSPDGFNWTVRSTPFSSSSNRVWFLAYAPELGMFVASSWGNRIITSTDAITWTEMTVSNTNEWWSIGWSAQLGMFVAGAGTGTGNRFMTWVPGSTDVPFVSRFASNGTRLWTRFMPAMGNARITSMKQTADSVLLGGSCQLWGTSYWQGCLYKVLKTNGQLDWMHRWPISNTSNSSVNAIDYEPMLDAAFAVGTTQAGFDFRTYIGGTTDTFICRHNMTTGNRTLVRLIGSSGADVPYSISIDTPRQAVYVTGSSGASNGADWSLMSTGSDQMLARLSLTDLSTQWARMLGGVGVSDAAVAVRVNSWTGLVFTTGQISASLPQGPAFQGGDSDMTLAVYYPNGTLGVAVAVGSASADTGESIDFYSNGSLSVLGTLEGNKVGLMLYDTSPFVVPQILSAWTTQTSAQFRTATVIDVQTTTATRTFTATPQVAITQTFVSTQTVPQSFWSTQSQTSQVSLSVTQMSTEYLTPPQTFTQQSIASLVPQRTVETVVTVGQMVQSVTTASITAPAPSTTLNSVVFVTLSPTVTATRWNEMTMSSTALLPFTPTQTVTQTIPTDVAGSNEEAPPANEQQPQPQQPQDGAVMMFSLIAGGAGLVVGIVIGFVLPNHLKRAKAAAAKQEQTTVQQSPSTLLSMTTSTNAIQPLNGGVAVNSAVVANPAVNTYSVPLIQSFATYSQFVPQPQDHSFTSMNQFTSQAAVVPPPQPQFTSQFTGLY